MLYFIFFFVMAAASMLKSNKTTPTPHVWLLSITSFLFVFKCASVGTTVLINNQMYPLFVDWFSFLLVVLSVLIIMVSILAGFGHVSKTKLGYYFFLMFLIGFFLVMFFSSWNLLLFFFLFEFVLLPMVLIIAMWGSQKDRLMANYYFFMYTIISGFPLMLILVTLSGSGQGFYFTYLMTTSFMSLFLLLCLSLAFLCKLPIYGLHIWLPKAHVEAPVSGSMVLAGLLLKMSGYSVFRICVVAMLLPGSFFSLFMGLLVIGVLYPLLICYRQNDMKSFIAYSSVGHMCVAVLGLVLYSVYGLKGALIIFISHGFISSSMFYICNLVYERTSSRMLMSLGGFESGLKGFLFYFLLLFIANMSYPPFISFFGEICVYTSLLGSGFFFVVFLFFFILISGVVMFHFISKITKSSEFFTFVHYFTVRERLSLFVLCFFIFLMTPFMALL